MSKLEPFLAAHDSATHLHAARPVMGRFAVELRQRLQLPAFLLIAIFVLGTAGYMFIAAMTGEKWTWLQCGFMTAITLSTVGYGDVLGLDGNVSATLYTMILMLIGMGIVLYSISIITAFLVEEGYSVIFQEHKMLKQISHMRNHYILAGGGSTGIHVACELLTSGEEFVVIDIDEDKLDRLSVEMPKANVLLADATADKALLNAGIEHAAGLVACLANDKDNLYLTVTARMLNPDIKIVARAVEDEVQQKLQRAGADAVVSPTFIGGMRLASQILRPNVVTFLDRMLRAGDSTTRVSEIDIKPGADLVGKALRESRIQEETGLLVVGVLEDGSDEYIYNPKAEYVLQGKSTIIVIGPTTAISKLREMAGCA
jgi:voltage-gated potassium channel